MNLDLDFGLPQKFIELKKNQLHQNSKADSFLCHLYNSYNKPQQNHFIQTKKHKKRETQQIKRMNKIKNILRNQNVQEKILLDSMTHAQKQQIQQQKKRIQSRIRKGREPTRPNQYTEFLDIIDVENSSKPLRTQKAIIYVNATKYKSNKQKLDNEECIEVTKSKEGNAFIPLQNPSNQIRAMYENNKTLHQKDTYKFNVNWWQNRQKQIGKALDKSQKTLQETPYDNLDPELAKSLKRQLKPLRKHKLVGTRYAPLSQFMPVSMYEKDGIRNGKLMDSSQSQDQIGRFQYYDNVLNQTYNPPGLIQLDEEKKKKKKRDKKLLDKQREHKQKRNHVDFDLKNRQQTFYDEPVVQRKLKRALIRMKNNDWKEDKLFTKGIEEDKPIQIDDIQ